jgi:hypothetical protein
MVLYTCFKKVNTDYYVCTRGIMETKEENLNDYRIISVPPSKLTYDILKSIEEVYTLKMILHEKVKILF